MSDFVIGGVGGVTFVQADAGDLYRPLHGGQFTTSDGTESPDRETLVDAAYTGVTIRGNISANTNDAATTLTLRVNQADTALSASIAANTTGEFSDTATVSIVSGDDVSIELGLLDLGHDDSLTLDWWTFEYTGTGDSTWVSNPLGSDLPQAGTRSLTIHGGRTGLSSKTGFDWETVAATTLDNARAVVISNNVDNASTIKLRIGGVNQNLSISMDANTTGVFSDTANSDSLSADDNISWQAVIGAGMTGDNLQVSSLSVRSSLDAYAALASYNGVISFASATRYYGAVPSNIIAPTTTEGDWQTRAEIDETVDRAAIGIVVNSRTTTTTLTFRDTGVDTNLVLSVTGSTTGIIQDTSNSHALAAADDINWKIVTGTGTETLSFAYLSVDLLQQAAGPTFSRSLAGDQPNATGTLTRKEQALRTPAGSQPAATGILARFAQVSHALAGDQPTATGILTRIEKALRALAGSQPSATGTLARAHGHPRSPTGAQPQATGILTRIEKALRALAGDQPSATGTLVRIEQAVRALTGSQPAATGILTRIEKAKRALTGSQPAATGTLAAVLTALSRSLAGTQPTATGTLSRVEKAFRAVVGNQPFATGVLTRIFGRPRSVAGVQPTATGTLTRIEQAVRSLAGSQPAATGTLSRIEKAVRALTGNQPSATGTLSRRLDAERALAGSQPSATGVLVRIEQAVRAVVGSQPSATGILTRVFGQPRSIAGSQPAASGVLTRIEKAFRALAGNQPAPSGTLVRKEQASRALTGNQPSATGTLIAVVIGLNRSLAGDQPASVGTLVRIEHAGRTLVGSQPAALGVLLRTEQALRALAGVQPSAVGVLVFVHIVLFPQLPDADATLEEEIVDARAIAQGVPVLASAKDADYIPVARAFIEEDIKKASAEKDDYVPVAKAVRGKE